MSSVIPAGVTTATALKCAELIKKFPAITQVWGYADPPSDHADRRCVDFMVYSNKALGDQISAYVKANAVRLGANGQIWYRQVMGFPHVTNPPYRGPWGVWRPYSGTPNPHTDHVHVEFDASAYIAPPAATALVASTLLSAAAPVVVADDLDAMSSPDVNDVSLNSLYSLIVDLQNQVALLQGIDKDKKKRDS